jgi:hypothetical protein
MWERIVQWAVVSEDKDSACDDADKYITEKERE